MVDEVEEGVVEPEEGQAVERVTVRRFRAPDALDRGGQPCDSVKVERVLDDGESVPLEPFLQHVATYAGRRRRGPSCD